MSSEEHASTSLVSAERSESQNLPEPYEAYLSYVGSIRTLSEHTRKAYYADLNQFVCYARAHKIDVLQPTHKQLRSYVNHLTTERYQPSTINRKISSIKGLFSWLVARGYTQIDVSDSLSSRKDTKHLPHRISQEDIKALVSYLYFDEHENPRCDPLSYRDQAIFEVMYASGLRIGEVCALFLDQVDLDSRRMRVIGKGSKERIVIIHDICVQSLTRYIHFGRSELVRDQKYTDKVFLSKNGRPLTTDAVRKLFGRWCRMAGIQAYYTPHDIRHTFASDMLEGGADLRSVQELLGHASLSTTQIYTHISPASLKNSYKQAHPRA